MGFAERVNDPVIRSKSGQPGLIDQALAAMPPEEAEHARRLLEGPKGDPMVAADFTAEGYPMKSGSVRTWRLSNRVQRFAP